MYDVTPSTDPILKEMPFFGAPLPLVEDPDVIDTTAEFIELIGDQRRFMGNLQCLNMLRGMWETDDHANWKLLRNSLLRNMALRHFTATD